MNKYTIIFYGSLLIYTTQIFSSFDDAAAKLRQSEDGNRRRQSLLILSTAEHEQKLALSTEKLRAAIDMLDGKTSPQSTSTACLSTSKKEDTPEDTLRLSNFKFGEPNITIEPSEEALQHIAQRDQARSRREEQLAALQSRHEDSVRRASRSISAPELLSQQEPSAQRSILLLSPEKKKPGNNRSSTLAPDNALRTIMPITKHPEQPINNETLQSSTCDATPSDQSKSHINLFSVAKYVSAGGALLGGSFGLSTLTQYLRRSPPNSSEMLPDNSYAAMDMASFSTNMPKRFVTGLEPMIAAQAIGLTSKFVLISGSIIALILTSVYGYNTLTRSINEKWQARLEAETLQHQSREDKLASQFKNLLDGHVQQVNEILDVRQKEKDEMTGDLISCLRTTASQISKDLDDMEATLRNDLAKYNTTFTLRINDLEQETATAQQQQNQKTSAFTNDIVDFLQRIAQKLRENEEKTTHALSTASQAAQHSTQLTSDIAHVKQSLQQTPNNTAEFLATLLQGEVDKLTATQKEREALDVEQQKKRDLETAQRKAELVKKIQEEQDRIKPQSNATGTGNVTSPLVDCANNLAKTQAATKAQEQQIALHTPIVVQEKTHCGCC